MFPTQYKAKTSRSITYPIKDKIVSEAVKNHDLRRAH